MLECLVSATLLIAMISVVVPLTVRANRIWQDARCYRLAVNELSNQLEELTLLGDEARAQALKNWKADDQLLQVLPEAQLSGETIDDAQGKRVRVSITWRRAGPALPITMMAWVQAERQ